MARILITAALPYVNGIKHLGNLVGHMLPADVYARFQRSRRNEVLCICATDEHGTPTELAAAEAGKDVETFCAEMHAAQAEIGERFGLSWDHFGRTSAVQNHELTQHLADQLDENGYIEARSIEQIYSIDDDRFLPDRYIVGTCPHCGYENARGDQCENCTRVLDPTDLLEPRSAISGSTNLEVRKSDHLYLRQSALAERLRDWVNQHADWPPVVSGIANKWLDEGLLDRGITRDIKWGISVTHETDKGTKWPEFEGKVFYVWFDAPIGYISATKEWADLDPDNRDWKSWWYGEAADSVKYVQFMGKDNVPFHTIGFPATILGSGEPWKLVDYIKGFNYLNYYGGQFSTSQKRGVFMDQALELLPADYWRYYLMANAPESSDSSFTWDHFASVVNSDLADVLGNFVNRVLKFTASRFDGAVPEGGEWTDLEVALASDLDQRITEYVRCLEEMEFRKAVTQLRAIWARGNEYLTVAAPWTKFKEDPKAAALGVGIGINLIHLYAHMSWPIIPATAETLHSSVGQGRPDGTLPWPKAEMREFLTFIKPGTALDVPEPLFRKLTDEDIELWSERFGGEAT